MSTIPELSSILALVTALLLFATLAIQSHDWQVITGLAYVVCAGVTTTLAWDSRYSGLGVIIAVFMLALAVFVEDCLSNNPPKPKDDQETAEPNSTLGDDR